MSLAYSAYAVLFASVITLAKVTNLFSSAFWISLVVVMLVGYLLAPHAIWHLCGEHMRHRTTMILSRIKVTRHRTAEFRFR